LMDSTTSVADDRVPSLTAAVRALGCQPFGFRGEYGARNQSRISVNGAVADRRVNLL
jgi:hypothetical protein